MVKYIFILLFFLIPSTTFAATSSVSVENVVNTSNSSSSSNETNVNTNIRIETNGKVTTYSSDKDENVEINIINGESIIKVDGELIEEDEMNSTTSPTLTPKSEMINEFENKNILELFENIFKSLFSLLV